MHSAEAENQAISDEESMNYRPLPNYKHKKYLRSKFEESMMMEANSSTKKPNASLLATAAAQPPLPPNPPPPDTPPIKIKQESKYDEYECEELKATTARIKTEQSEDKPNVSMCRNFARGTCQKGAACIFSHELILSQLPGVYTFCRNFQNSVCSFPKCKFVHATVFEKEHFYRTGYLPPHTTAHLKEQTEPQPPLPPSQPAEASAELLAEQPAVYYNVPPQLSCYSPMALPCNTEIGIEQLECSTNTASSNRVWNEIGEGSSTTLDCNSGESPPKQCKTCPSTELTEQLMRARFTEATLRNKERMQKIAQIDKKNAKLSMLLRLLKSDQDINYLMTPNHNLTAILAILMKNLDSGLPPDSS